MSKNHKTSFGTVKNIPSKNTKAYNPRELFKLLKQRPMSRRMAATELGFKDQSYMVTQLFFDWIKQGRAYVVGSIICERSGRKVQGVTTNKELAKKLGLIKDSGNE